MTSGPVDVVLEHIRQQVAAADPLTQAFAEWLGVYDLGSAPFGPAAGLWTPRDVAVAALREASEKTGTRPFAAGLSWLRSREFFRPHMPAVFEADPLAILAVSVGIRHRQDAAAATWMTELATRAAVDESDSWRAGMLAGALAVVSTGSVRAPPELSAALATRGIGVTDDATWTAAFHAAMLLDDAPVDRLVARLAVLSRPGSFISGIKPTVTTQFQRHSPMRVLVLSANPTTTNVVLLDEEFRAIEQNIRLSEYRNRLDVVSKWAVRPDDLQLALLQHKPTIVHFSGHGSGSPGIVLHGDVPGTDSVVTGDALMHLFATLKRNIRMVVLNACESAEQAEAIIKVVDFVVGMGAAIDDDSARKFAGSFYLGIASGESVKTAFQLGISAVKLHGLPDDNVPRLYVRVGVSEDEVLCGE